MVPLWIAPNLITMVGLMVNIITTLILVAYCPTATEIPPWWTTALCAAGLFIYQVLRIGLVANFVVVVFVKVFAFKEKHWSITLKTHMD